MPELPEVEITRRHLADVLTGAVLVDVSVRHQRTARNNSGAKEVEERLTGRRVVSVSRHGKFLDIELDDGQTLAAHLGMSGRFTVNGQEEKHTHFEAVLDTGDVVRFVDPRTFGFIAVYNEEERAASGLARLGPDAWIDLPVDLGVVLADRTAPIKALLLDQSVVAGLGNIYADEVLHLAGIHPLRPGGSLGDGEIEAMGKAVTTVLAIAIEHGGTSLDDLAYLLPDGRAGENLDRLQVYGRADEPCLTCGTPIERIVVRGRSTHFCPGCQSYG